MRRSASSLEYYVIPRNKKQYFGVIQHLGRAYKIMKLLYQYITKHKTKNTKSLKIQSANQND